MPSARATARRDRSVPTSASCLRASRLISSVISARARARAVVGALATGMAALCTETRAVATITSSALDSRAAPCDHRSMTRAPLTDPATRYVPPTRSAALMNWTVRHLVRLGISVWGARELRLRGRKSGRDPLERGQPSRPRRGAVPRRSPRHDRVGEEPPGRGRWRAPGRSPGRAVRGRRAPRPARSCRSCAPTSSAGSGRSASSSRASGPMPPTPSSPRSRPGYPIFRIRRRAAA